eukprot:403352920
MNSQKAQQQNMQQNVLNNNQVSSIQNQSNKINAEQIKVCIRMRPLLPPYEDQDVWGVDYKDNKIFSLNSNLASTLDPVQIAMGQMGNGQQMNINAFIREKELRRRYQDAMQTQSFNFDNVFGIDVKTPQIYHVIARPITKAALQGYNGTVFMYGQTTSGKTYTMLGTQDIPGILPCAVRDVFNGIKNDSVNNEYKVWVSYMEIYNECINDLLAPGKTNLKIKEDPNHGVDVADLKKQQVFSFDQAIILMNYGEEHRIYKETSIHEHSSRSHTIFRLYIESCPLNKAGPQRYSMLNLVDLAGSERLNDFESKSDTLGETGYINKSLFILSNVINKLAEGKSGHIPYRDSKLTRILQMALGGNSLTAIICTISPAAINYYQSLSTLRFATRAKTVKNKPCVNEIVDEQEFMNQMYKKEIEQLREQVAIKESELMKYHESHLRLQQNLSQEKEQKEQLNKEIFEIKSQTQASQQHQEENHYKVEMLKNKLQQERQEKEELINQVEMLKQQNFVNNQTQNFASEETSKFIENLAQQIEEVLIEQFNIEENQEYFYQIPEEKIQLSQNQLWVSEVDKLSSNYKIDLLNLQMTYKQQMQNVLQSIYNQQNEQFLLNMISEGVLKISETTQRENSSQFANAEKVLHDIDQGIVFDDVLIEYEEVYMKSIQSLGHNMTNLMNGLIFPSKEELNKVIEDLKEYYGELIQVVQKRYDEVKNILETYFRQLIAMKREELDIKHENDEISEEDFQEQANTFAQITDTHNEKLTRLRESFDAFSRHIDERFDEQIEKINHQFNEVEIDFQESDQSDIDSQLRNIQQRQNFKQNSFTPQSQRQNNDQGIQNQLMMNQRDLNNFQMSIHSMQEEPPEVRASINSHQQVTPTPKFSQSNKFRNQSSAQRSNKENNQTIKQTYGSYDKKEQMQLLPRIKLKIFGQVNKNQSYKVFVWGSGKDGRCGNGKESSEKLPNQANTSHNFTQLSCGYHHSAAVTSDGMILSWGRGIFGQLGHGDTENYSLPTPIEALVKIQIIQVSCGWQHSMALSSQGRIFSWGYGEDGQLGHGDTNDYLLPKEIDFFRKNSINVGMIACGHSHSGCITDGQSSQLYLWGCNPDCRLMIEENENQLLPTLTILEQAKMKNYERGDQLKLEGLEPCYLSLGVTHTAIVTRSGELYTGGSMLDGQLGVNYEAAKNDQSYPSSLSNTHQLINESNSSFINQFKDQKELKSQSLPIYRVDFFSAQNKATQVSCGDAFTIVLNERNEVYAFGKLSHGRLGVGNGQNLNQQKTNQLKQSIQNQTYQSTEGSNDCIAEPQLLQSLSQSEKVVQISAGCRHAACVTDSGKLYAWGFNFYEQLGLGDSEKDFDVPTKVSKGLQSSKVKFVSCGYFHTGALVQQTNQ